MSKQTAVEFYEAELTKINIKLEHNEISIGVFSVIKFQLFEQAKEMEKQQLMDSWNNQFYEDSIFTAEQYYNETFNKI